MNRFNFEKNLSHQTEAVENTISVFKNLEIKKDKGVDKNYINPYFNTNQDNIIDIMMETGTGKTYTYTKTIFELNKNFGIFKFVILVPTLSIKAGTINFLKSDSAKEHFKELYGKTVKLHIVQSGKSKKNKKQSFPSAINSFVNSGNYEKNSIQVMIINAGMINSETMQKSFDKGLFDKYTIPFEAIRAVKPFLIIDEPHKFAKANKTWENILKMEPQFILRYGATFPETEKKQKDYHNLVYTLTAVDAFNRNLVKGVIAHITEFENGKNALVKFVNSDGKEATFEVLENGKKESFKISKKESLKKIHSQMSDLFVENLNKSTVVLSNGLEMKKGDKLNPYSYAQKLQEIMIQKTIKNHFQLEKKYLSREVKIKPITLFFIDNIEEYRDKDGYIKKSVEEMIKIEVEKLLKTEKEGFYKKYLQKTLENISLTHGGYFSKDNSQKDEVIEKEINEILHDKEAILDLDNPRRFIFSKWTLKEGWDNPNVFQICKLRNSGSEISKLQEVGRGLRLPVNEYGNRVKDEQFYLHYFVDFTESDFVDKLVNEINEKSEAISIEKNPDNPIFQGVNSNKIRKSTDKTKKITIRTEKYYQLKELWEKLNEKVILEYKFDNEIIFQNLFTNFLKEQKKNFNVEGIRERKSKIEIQDNQAVSNEEISVLDNEIVAVSTMKYSDFIKGLAKSLNINLKTIHKAIIDSGIEINRYLNPTTIRIIKQNFDNFLMFSAIDKFSIEYQKISNSIHPTKLTDKNGEVFSEISSSDVGIFYSDEKVADSYFFKELFYDSELEKDNIKEEINEVVVFTKIPINSVKIPVAGGKSYSPDFAYVLNFENGEKRLHFIVETKNVNSENSLREEEKQKIKHAEKFFNGEVKIEFKTQFSSNKIVDLIGVSNQGETLEDVINNADKMLYLAKKTRNRVVAQKVKNKT